MQDAFQGQATAHDRRRPSASNLVGRVAAASRESMHAAYTADPHAPEHPLMAPLRAIGMLEPARGGMRLGHTAAAAAAALLSPLQLVRAFSNVYTVTCAQLLELLQELPPVARAATARSGADADAAEAGEQVPAAVVALGKPAVAEWAALQSHRRVRRERERVSAVQMLFAHVADLLHFSIVMRVRHPLQVRKRISVSGEAATLACLNLPALELKKQWLLAPCVPAMRLLGRRAPARHA